MRQKAWGLLVTRKVIENAGVNFKHCEQIAEKAGLTLVPGTHGRHGYCFARK